MKRNRQKEESTTELARATISLPPRVKIWADEMREQKGYHTFSAYVADLIRRDRGVPFSQAA